jgi:broad specificity phosphatase PhoE
MAERTIVHMLRHGEVYNPTGVLYGRLPDFHLSDLGRQMAQRVGQVLSDRDISYVVASPLVRAQETAAPIAEAHGVDLHLDADLIEAANVLQGEQVGMGAGLLKKPALWRHLWNPFTPSWGEPYTEISDRMDGAIDRTREAARGHEAVLVSHQLPNWIARLAREDRSFAHNPRNRQCSLASLTSLVYDDDDLSAIVYTEPCADLVAKSSKGVGA